MSRIKAILSYILLLIGLFFWMATCMLINDFNFESFIWCASLAYIPLFFAGFLSKGFTVKKFGLWYITLLLGSAFIVIGTVVNVYTDHHYWEFGALAAGCVILIVSGIRFIDSETRSLNGFEYEEWCANYLRTHGYHDVVVTPGSGDYGADVIGYDRYNNKWVFQCKLYTGKVSNTAVQEVVAAKAHYQANKGAVMTNSQLTDNARKLAWENDIELFEMID